MADVYPSEGEVQESNKMQATEHYEGEEHDAESVQESKSYDRPSGRSMLQDRSNASIVRFTRPGRF